MYFNVYFFCKSYDLFVNLFIYPSNNPSIHPSFNPSIHQSINPSIYLSIYSSIYLHIYSYIYLSTIPKECIELICPFLPSWWANNSSSLVVKGSCTESEIKWNHYDILYFIKIEMHWPLRAQSITFQYHNFSNFTLAMYNDTLTLNPISWPPPPP